ncbi:hypothetical protein [Bradyrhizobium sp. CCBAU 45384]|uniref:hypothetical protein n=1 Tax=Bradyrhizobium sp. CCBAU 45384 TaxID=858428 RepID=UPI002305F071|nr:hypothetical protein [Bradyrhizobium sp. CCBAU 45384]
MTHITLIAGIAAVVATAGASAAELPTFEVMGFPISPHQVAVVGAADVQEQSAVPALTLGGMPASPTQVAILTPRSKVFEATAEKPILATAGFSAR